jgi:chromosome segregation ATPase
LKIDWERVVLAPLKDRSILEHDDSVDLRPPPSAPQANEAPSEILDLRQALRESRTRLRRSAWQSTQQICTLNSEIDRLHRQCREQQRQLDDFMSGVAIIKLGQTLMRYAENNERLKGAAHQLWQLEKKLEAAHFEYRQLADERNALAQEIHELKLNRLTA